MIIFYFIYDCISIGYFTTFEILRSFYNNFFVLENSSKNKKIEKLKNM